MAKDMAVSSHDARVVFRAETDGYIARCGNGNDVAPVADLVVDAMAVAHVHDLEGVRVQVERVILQRHFSALVPPVDDDPLLNATEYHRADAGAIKERVVDVVRLVVEAVLHDWIAHCELKLER